MINDYLNLDNLPKIANEEERLRIDLVRLMNDLRDRNEKLPRSEKLPYSFFSVFMRGIGSWYIMRDELKLPAKHIFQIWKNNYGHNDIHFLDRLDLSEREQEIIDKYIQWAHEVQKTIEAGGVVDEN